MKAAIAIEPRPPKLRDRPPETTPPTTCPRVTFPPEHNSKGQRGHSATKCDRPKAPKATQRRDRPLLLTF